MQREGELSGRRARKIGLIYLLQRDEQDRKAGQTALWNGVGIRGSIT